MLSDSPERQKRRIKKRPVVAETNLHWSDTQKIEAVKTYLILGSMALTAGALQIPHNTIRAWKQKEWWKAIEADLRTEDELQLSSRLKQIASKALDETEDRLKNGNYIFDQKAGKLKRVPVSMREAHQVAVSSIEQRDLIASRNYERLNDGQVENKLEQLAQRFAELATRKITEIVDEERTIELVEEVDDAVHEEREEGLQAGERAVQLEAGGEEEEEFADGSPKEGQRFRPN
jgi:hypothetical protein